MSQRQQVRRALAERDRAAAVAAASRAIRMQSAGMLVDGLIAAPVAQEWLRKRQAAQGAVLTAETLTAARDAIPATPIGSDR